MVYSEDKCFFLILEKDIPQNLCTPHAEHIRIVQKKKSYKSRNSLRKDPILTVIISGV